MQRQLALAVLAVAVMACEEATSGIAPASRMRASADGAVLPSYEWVPLDTTSTFATGSSSRAVGVNNLGQVIGTTAGAGTVSGFLWQDGLMEDLGTLGGNTTSPTDVNERGQVVGWATTADGSRHAFFWERGAIQDLGPVLSMASALDEKWLRGVHINERGQVVGDQPGGGVFLWERGVAQSLPLEWASAINTRGQVVGWVLRDVAGVRKRRAAVWEDGVLTELGTLGGDEGWAVAVTTTGWVVGSSRTDLREFEGRLHQELHPFRWREGVLEDLGRPDCCEADWEALLVDDQGRVVARDPSGFVNAVWDNGTWQFVSGLPTQGLAVALDMSRRGAITGGFVSGTPNDALVWQDGVMQHLGAGAGDNSRGLAVNDRGVVAGYTGQARSYQRAALWVPAQGGGNELAATEAAGRRGGDSNPR